MRATPISLPATDREELTRWTRSPRVPAGLAQRARIILLIADGISHTEISHRLSVTRQTVINWRNRYQDLGVDGLADRSRPGRPRTLDYAHLIATTLAPPPSPYGVSQWTSRLLARHLGIGHGTVARVWRQQGIQPWRADAFKFSTAPELVTSTAAFVGLYLAPPDNAVVLQVEYPPPHHSPGHRRPVPPHPDLAELSVALETKPGRATEPWQPRFRHQGPLALLKAATRSHPGQPLRLVMDGPAANRHQLMRGWLAENPHIRVHWTPTPASWINLVEVWLGIHEYPRDSANYFQRALELTARIRAFTDTWNPTSSPLMWTAPPTPPRAGHPLPTPPTEL